MDALAADDEPGIGLEVPVASKRHPVFFQRIGGVLHGGPPGIERSVVGVIMTGSNLVCTQ